METKYPLMIMPEPVNKIVDNLSEKEKALKDTFNSEEMARERRTYNNPDHFIAAILLRYNEVPTEKIAQILGYNVRTIERWFAGGSEAFSKELLKTGTRVLLMKVLPGCIKAMENAVDLAVRIQNSFKDKPDSQLTEKEWFRLIEGVKVSSRRADEVLERITTILIEPAQKNIAIFGGEQHFGDKNVVFTNINDMAKHAEILNRRVQKKLAQAQTKEKDSDSSTEPAK